MEVKVIKRKLKESLGDDGILEILSLIGKAHDLIMEAQDKIGDLRYEYDDIEDDVLDVLEDALDDLESSLSKYDHMGEDDPVESFKEEHL